MAPLLGSDQNPLEHSHGASVTWAKVVATPSKETSPEKITDRSNDDAGPGPQAIRGGGMSGFPSQQQQQQSQARNASIPPSRLPNGKLGVFPILKYEIEICIIIGS